MKEIIYPLKDNWKIDEDKGFVADQIEARMDSESWYTNCKGYYNIKEKDIKGRAGKPLPGKVEYYFKQCCTN